MGVSLSNDDDYQAIIKITGRDNIPPNPERTKEAFARVGYQLGEAIADLIDNSIDAGAQDVLVRFLYGAKGIRRIFIADNGKGMSDTKLRDAMRFGSTITHSDRDLGKYGIGLKSASLSHCRTFSVITRDSTKQVSGRRWSNDAINKDWECGRLDPAGCRALMAAPFGPVAFEPSGTIVVWEDLIGFGSGQSKPDEIVNRAISSLSKDLGLVFHRHLKSGKIRIHLDCVVTGNHQGAVVQSVKPLDPFSYAKSGASNYPRTLIATLEGGDTIKLHAHIWPAKSNEEGYRLGGGKVAARQGFYFYRNDRLIQAGGWNGFRDDDAEPHLSLARVAVDLPPGIDVSIQKNKVERIPGDFVKSIRQSSDGEVTFPSYIKAAEKAYRTKGKATDHSDYPLVPKKGVSAEVQKVAQQYLSPESRRVREVDFRWGKLAAGTVVHVDRERQQIVLNELYRKPILAGKQASKNDAPMVKMLLFMLLSDYFDYQALTKARVEYLEALNLLLLKSIDG